MKKEFTLLFSLNFLQKERGNMSTKNEIPKGVNISSKFKSIENLLNEKFVERADEIRGLTLAIISGTNVLFLGPPGTSKSLLVRKYCSAIKDSKYFEQLLTKHSAPESLFGGPNLKILKDEGKYYRVVKDMLPEAHIAFLDETFKGSAAILNALLTLMNEKIFHDGEKLIKSPLISLIGASNEIPEESDGLNAFYDRFLQKYIVSSIKEKANRKKMFSNETIDDYIEPIITLDEIMQAQLEAKSIIIPEEMLYVYGTLIEKLMKIKISASDRTYKQALKLVKAEAYLRGGTEVIESDFEVLKNIVWVLPEDRMNVTKAVYSVINPVKGDIENILQSANDIEKDLYKLKEEHDTKEKSKKNKEDFSVVHVTQAISNLRELVTDLEKLLKQNKGNAKVEPLITNACAVIENKQKYILKDTMGFSSYGVN